MPGSVDAVTIRRWCAAGLAALRRHRTEIDALNVYPVPDGDTGTNLALTMTAAAGALAEAGPEEGLGEVLRVLARGALLGARGNSGIILAQVFKGLAETLATAEAADGRLLARALDNAARAAYQAVAAPVEGTVLSVGAAAAQAALAAAALNGHPGAVDNPTAAPADRASDDRASGDRASGDRVPADRVPANRVPADSALAGDRIPGNQVLADGGDALADQDHASADHADAPADRRDANSGRAGADGAVGGGVPGSRDAAGAGGAVDVVPVVRAAAAAARVALARTPEQLPALARAGVVDAGGRGLVVLLDALVGVVTGEDVDSPPDLSPPRGGPVGGGRPDAMEREAGSVEFGYEVQYLLDAQAAVLGMLRRELAALGDSLVVVGDEPTWHIHVHVNDVGAAIEAGIRAGRPSRITVTRFADQVAARGDQATARGDQIPVRGDQATARGDQIPVRGDQATAGGDQIPVRGDQATAGGDQIPVRGDQVAARGNQATARGDQVPVGGDQVPARGDQVPAGGDQTKARADQVAGGGDQPGPALRERAVVVACSGPGLAELLAAEGATVVRGTPSTGEVLDAIRRTGAERVVVLPNDANVLAVANAAAGEARALGIRAGVVPTRSPVQALAAIAVRDAQRRFEDDVIAMAEAAARCRSAEMTFASREALTVAGRCQPGDVLAIVEGEVNLIGQDLVDTACRLLDRLLAAGGELVTLVTGEGAPSELGEVLRSHVAGAWPFVEVQCFEGGQPHYPLLVGVE